MRNEDRIGRDEFLLIRFAENLGTEQTRMSRSSSLPIRSSVLNNLS